MKQAHNSCEPHGLNHFSFHTPTSLISSARACVGSEGGHFAGRAFEPTVNVKLSEQNTTFPTSSKKSPSTCLSIQRSMQFRVPSSWETGSSLCTAEVNVFKKVETAAARLQREKVKGGGADICSALTADELLWIKQYADYRTSRQMAAKIEQHGTLGGGLHLPTAQFLRYASAPRGVTALIPPCPPPPRTDAGRRPRHGSLAPVVQSEASKKRNESPPSTVDSRGQRHAPRNTCTMMTRSSRCSIPPTPAPVPAASHGTTTKPCPCCDRLLCIVCGYRIKRGENTCRYCCSRNRQESHEPEGLTPNAI